MENSNPDTVIPTVVESPSTKHFPIIFSSLLFLFIGVVVGYFTAIYLPILKTPEAINPQPKTCTPRPTCLDATPRCMISETADMCPASITPTISSLPLNTQTIKDDNGSYQIRIPKDWVQQENMSGNVGYSSFEAPDKSILRINILDSKTTSLSVYLAKQDEVSKTSWEGQPGSKVISSIKTTLIGLPAIERVEEWSAAGFQVVSTYVLVNNTVYQFTVLPGMEDDYRKTFVFSNYQTVLKTFEPLSPASSFVCPTTEYVDCMPGPGAVKTQCSSEFISWASANCPDFKGAAL